MTTKSIFFLKLMLASISLGCFSNSSFAQTKNNSETKSTIEEEDREAKPNFDFPEYLNENLKYPLEAVKAGVQGKVEVKFVVEVDGVITAVSVSSGQELGNGLPEEAIRVISNMPKWIPAYMGTKAVKSYFTVPITFQIPDPNELEEIEEEIYSIIGDSQAEGSVAGAKAALEPKPGYDWDHYLMNNLRYPREALEKNIQGKLTVEFIVTKTGEIRDIKIIQGEDLGGGLSEEAIRIIKTMPKWIPGKINGISVDSYHSVPITFKLQ